MAPARELAQIIGTHEPDEAHIREAAAQLAHRICGILGAQALLDIGCDDAPSIGDAARLGEALRERGHARARLQRVAGLDHEPELVQPQMDDRLARNMQMPLMRRVEGTAQNADALMVPMAEMGNQGRICPAPRTT